MQEHLGGTGSTSQTLGLTCLTAVELSYPQAKPGTSVNRERGTENTGQLLAGAMQDKLEAISLRLTKS